MEKRKRKWFLIETQNKEKTILDIVIKMKKQEIKNSKGVCAKGICFDNKEITLDFFSVIRRNEVIIIDGIEHMEKPAAETLKLIIEKENIILPSGEDLKKIMPHFTFIAITEKLSKADKVFQDIAWDRSLEKELNKR